ncbi:hypothetical protein TH66_17195 [Carbonactinospora thermoautotrophica]|uniref:Putative Tn3 family ISSod9-like transposase n=1 Tax=Carbonactinospora thermoautotrophica TaxID=1469144 RepID=A0A132MRM7_9ACTN|nr:Tn3 family transposase [Carbonactinospora thermoautotrophica]KWX00491.1 hypothetical protein TH66_17195 [Carbonactinospora thermoautotrophica]KWX01444.1 putative Tn3 family ISSod9-like transposase [Carbonactinospora thermoautotrophica]KWX08484.1 hypothetical protein TR74_14815 [Carbonactinospora thermoautotrophica]
MRRSRPTTPDTHGTSVAGFPFTELLGFRLLPRLKNIGAIRLHSPDAAPGAWPKLQRIIKNRPIIRLGG